MAAILFVLAVLIPAVPAGARPPSRSFWGIDYPFLDLQQGDLGRIHRGRVGSLRLTLNWADVSAGKGAFNWARPDKTLGDLASIRVPVLLDLYGSPGYAAKTNRTPPLGSSSARRGWKQFVGKVAARYGRGGRYWTDPSLYASQHPGARPLPLRTLQIWNEPNLAIFFNPKPSPRKYARLLRMSHNAIKRRDPHARIVLAGLPGLHAAGFLDKLYRINGFKRDFDAAAVHPYSPNLHFFRVQIGKFRRSMTQHHDAHTPLWITELGWGSGKPDGLFNVGRQGQKRMLKNAFRLALHKRLRWHLRRFYWFNWRDLPHDPASHCDLCKTGLFTNTGQPKPSWKAFKHFTGALG